MNEENFKEEVHWSGVDSSHDTSDMTVSWNKLNPVQQ